MHVYMYMSMCVKMRVYGQMRTMSLLTVKESLHMSFIKLRIKEASSSKNLDF